MATTTSAGARFRAALAREKPLQVPGAICAYHAILAEKSGFQAIYLSGGGVAAGSLGVPDLGITTLDDVLTDVRRITDACALPLLVDVDTGFGASAFNVARTVRSLIKAGAAAMHIEDQVGAKRCGHRPNKELVSKEEMVDRIKAAVDAREDSSLVLIARCDARCSEPLAQVQERLSAYVEAGVDAVGVQLSDPEEFRDIGARSRAPLVSLWPKERMTIFEFFQLGFRIALMPSSLSLAALAAAKEMLLELKETGTERDYFSRQKNVREVERWYRDLHMRGQ